MRIGLDEVELRMLLAGGGNHLRRKIHAYAVGGFELRQQIALRATDLEHPQSGSHQVAVDLRQTLVVEAIGGLPTAPIPGYVIPMAEAVGAMRLTRPGSRLLRRRYRLRLRHDH